MTRFDLHPEDLLERAERSSLGAADLTRLEQHLAECSVCRVERALKLQAAADTTPLRDEKLLLARLKRDVTERLQASPPERKRRKGAVVAVVLVAASLASVAAAATVVVLHRVAPVETLASARHAPTKAGKAQPAAHLAAPAPIVEMPSTPDVADEPAPSIESAAKPTAVEVSSAAEAFSRANLARRDGKVKEAVRLYRILQERFAGSSEELVSRVALGRLLLDRLGDSRGALVQFNSYLASPGSGALREEAMVGRALSLERLGRSTEERAAWTALLQAWPKSAHAKRAQSRLAELGDATSGRR
jgi:TolA-binding protein